MSSGNVYIKGCVIGKHVQLRAEVPEPAGAAARFGAPGCRSVRAPPGEGRAFTANVQLLRRTSASAPASGAASGAQAVAGGGPAAASARAPADASARAGGPNDAAITCGAASRLCRCMRGLTLEVCTRRLATLPLHVVLLSLRGGCFPACQDRAACGAAQGAPTHCTMPGAAGPRLVGHAAVGAAAGQAAGDVGQQHGEAAGHELRLVGARVARGQARACAPTAVP